MDILTEKEKSKSSSELRDGMRNGLGLSYSTSTLAGTSSKTSSTSGKSTRSLPLVQTSELNIHVPPVESVEITNNACVPLIPPLEMSFTDDCDSLSNASVNSVVERIGIVP